MRADKMKRAKTRVAYLATRGEACHCNSRDAKVGALIGRRKTMIFTLVKFPKTLATVIKRGKEESVIINEGACGMN